MRGNPDHPFTRGRLCVKVNDYEEPGLQRRAGPASAASAWVPRARGQFERISWDEAIDEIATRWKSIIAEHGAQAILPYSYLGTQGIINGLNVGDPFFNKLGATVSRTHVLRFGVVHRLYDDDRPHRRGRSRELRALEIHRAVGVQHARHQPAQWPFIEQAKKAGAKLVVIDPVRTRTARRPTGTFRSGPAPTRRWRWR